MTNMISKKDPGQQEIINIALNIIAILFLTDQFRRAQPE